MGWTWQESKFRKDNGTIDRKAECDRIINYENDNVRFEVLKSAMKGSVYYAAVKRVDKGNDESDVWICDWEMLESISRGSDFDIWIGTTDKYGGEHHYYLTDLLPTDRIEVAEFLCRR